MLIRGSCQFCGHGCHREGREDLDTKYPDDRVLHMPTGAGFIPGEPVCHVCLDKISAKIREQYEKWAAE